MKLYPMKGGISLKEAKKADPRLVTHIAITPQDIFYIPFIQNVGVAATPIVEKGQTVKAGQLIATIGDKLGSNVHSSVDGTVMDIKDVLHPSLGLTQGAVIKAGEQSHEYEHLNTDQDFEDLIRDAGIVGLGGAGFPTYVKYAFAKSNINTLIINASECEPYLTCDQSLIVKGTARHIPYLDKFPAWENMKIPESSTVHGDRYKDIVTMIEYLKNEIGAKRVILALEGNRTSDAEPFVQLLKSKNIEIARLKSKYPQGSEKQLTYAILGKEVPRGQLPVSLGVLIQNVATVAAMHDAKFKSKPLIERIVTVSGDIPQSYNVAVKVGSTIGSVLRQLDINSEEYTRVIAGGFMTGYAISSLDTPIIKTTNAILLFKSHTKQERIMPCFRCGRCIETCVMGLSPTEIEGALSRGDIETAIKYNIMDCIDCGCCSYQCIASRNLAESIRLGKKKAAIFLSTKPSEHAEHKESK